MGARLKEARRRRGLTQQQLAADRYTKAYVSALEHGLVRPSMTALTFFAERLQISPSWLISDETPSWSRLEADLLLAGGRWQAAVDAYAGLLDDTTDPLVRAELLTGRAEALTRLNRGGEAAADAAQGVRTFTAHGRHADAALATYWLAFAQYQQDNLAEARALLQDVLARIRGGLQTEPDLGLRVLMALSTVESNAGEHARALAYLEEVRSVADQLDDRRRATFYFDLAYSYRETGDLEAAVASGHKSLALFRAMESETEVGELENDLALAYLAMGNLSRAGDLASSARQRFTRLHDERWLAHVDDTCAQIALAGKHPEEALELSSLAVASAERTSNQKALIAALTTRAKALAAVDRFDEAIASFERAAALARDEGPRAWLRDVLADWAELMARLGRHEQAYELMREGRNAG